MSEIDWTHIDNFVKKFSLYGFNIECKIVSVYDGDTVNVVFPLNLINKNTTEFYKFSCRLINIDTPEIRTDNEEEKKRAYLIRDKLREKILNKVVKIKCYDFDKYGRLLIEIFYDDININNWLLENNYAKLYDGGKKSEWIF